MEAVIGLISAVLVAVITQLAVYLRDRKNHKESRQDAKEDKQDAILERIDDVSTEVRSLSDRVDANEAKHARTRILRFEGEILNGQIATKDSWHTILEDIDAYETYCTEHPNFKNGIAVHAIAHLQKTYDECIESNNFLF